MTYRKFLDLVHAMRQAQTAFFCDQSQQCLPFDPPATGRNLELLAEAKRLELMVDRAIAKHRATRYAAEALAAILLLLAPTLARADGMFCWDPVPGATAYRIYAAAPRPPGAAWSCIDERPAADVCSPTVCCALVRDVPAPLAFYMVTARAADPASESDGHHGPKVSSCPELPWWDE